MQSPVDGNPPNPNAALVEWLEEELSDVQAAEARAKYYQEWPRLYLLIGKRKALTHVLDHLQRARNRAQAPDVPS